MITIQATDRLPIKRLCGAADIPQSELLPLLTTLGFPFGVETNGDVYTSRSSLRRLLRTAASKPLRDPRRAAGVGT